MPIEHAVPSEDMASAMPAMEGDTDENSEQPTLPLSLLGGQEVAEGDLVKLRVTGVDQEGGTFTVEYPKPEKSSIEEAASKFDESAPMKPLPESGD